MLWYRRKKFIVLLGFALSGMLAMYIFLLGENRIPQRTSSRSWHHVIGTIYVYSAFWDNRDQRPYVRVLTVGPYDEQLTQVQCYVKYDAEEPESIVHSAFHVMDFDNHGENHSVVFFLCFPSKSSKPSHVALGNPPDKRSKWVAVQSMQPEKDIRNRTAVCVRPLFGKYPENLSHLVEFVAYYTLIGVTHFVFYDFRADKSVRRVLKLLAMHDISLEVLPWDIPEAVEHSWQYGQAASITDCVYRMASTHEYVAIVDVDEFIVPKKNATLQAILQSLTDLHSHKSASYVFRHSFFCMDYSDHRSASRLPLHLLTQTKTIRKPLTPLSNRGKSIVRPLAVVFPGIHRILLSHNEWQSMVVVDPRVAKLHHYRKDVCSFRGRFGYGTVEDFTALKFKHDLLKSLPLRMWLKVNGY